MTATIIYAENLLETLEKKTYYQIKPVEQLAIAKGNGTF
jgi:hypothetical protein